jgi:hypothetical protein
VVFSGVFHRLLPAFLLVLLFPAALYAEPAEERERRGELIRILTEAHIPFEIRPLLGNYGEFGSSVQVSIPAGESGNPFAEDSGVLTLGIPLNPRSSGPPESVPLASVPLASGPALPFAVETGLAFIRRTMDAGGISAAVRVIFLGGEGRKLAGLPGWDHPGLRDAVSQLDNPENAVLLYLDMGEAPESIEIHHGSGGAIAPLHVVRPLLDLDIPLHFAVRNNELYKLFLVRGPPVLEIGRTAGLSGLYLEGLNGQVPGSAISAETMGEQLFKYAVSLDFSGVGADTHYSFINLPGRILFLSEFAAAALFFFTAALTLLMLLIYSALARPMLVLQWRFFLRRSWLLLLVFVLIFGALYGTAFCLSLVLKGFAVPPSRVYYGGAALQLCAIFFCFLLISRLCNYISIPRKAKFYGNAAVALVVLGTLAAAVLDITFIPVFFWAFLWVLPASLFKAPVLVFLCALALPLQAVGAIKNVIDTGSREMIDLILERNIPFILNMTLIAMPVFMICKRGSALIRGKTPQPGKRRFIYNAACGILLVLSLLSLTAYGAHLGRNPPEQPIRRTVEEGLVLTMNERTLLERRILDIRIEAPGSPGRIDLYLDTETAMPVIYDAPVPFEYGEEGRTVRFILGEAPPVPLDMEIVVSLGFSGLFRAEALYDFSGSGTGDYTLKMTGALPLD